MHEEGTKKFALAGSKAHYAPSLAFTVSHMRLEVEPDLKARTIQARQELEITAVQGVDAVELDAAELDIKSVSAGGKKLAFRTIGDRLAIKLAKKLGEGERATLAISYSARPRKGLYFVGPDRHYPDKYPEVWSQV